MSIIYGGSYQPDLKLTKKTSVKFKLQDGSTVEHNHQRGSIEDFLRTMLGYAITKYGDEAVIEMVEDWKHTFNESKVEGEK